MSKCTTSLNLFKIEIVFYVQRILSVTVECASKSKLSFSSHDTLIDENGLDQSLRLGINEIML